MNAAGWVVAGYAAVVSTTSLAWQVISWHLARKNRVTVQVRFGMLDYPTGLIDAVLVKVINRSDHTVRVTGVGLDLQDGSGRTVPQVRIPEGAEIPGAVASHDSGSTHFVAEALAKEAGFDIYGKFVAFANLATGETVKSKPTTIRTRD